MRIARLSIVTALAAAALIFCSAPARAQQPTPDPAAIEKAKKHFADGQTKYNAGDKAGAVEEFKEAYKLTRNALLLYNIGFVYDELHDKPLAVHYYEKFLSDAPDNERTAPNRKLASERIPIIKKEIADEEAAAQRAAEEAARAAEEAARKEREKASKSDTRVDKGVTEFVHEVVEEAPPKFPLDIIALIPEDSNWSLTLYFRAAGEDEFKTVKMAPRYQEMVGRIPATAMLGNSVQYYIEVKDKGGSLVASSGRAASPNIVYIDPSAKKHYYADLSEGGSGDFASDDVDITGPAVGNGKVKDKRGPLFWAKWGATAGTAVAVTMTIVFHQTAANNAAALEAEAKNSQGGCGNPPCRTFSGTQKGYQDDGQFAETMTNVMLFVSVGVAATAGVFWYLDLKDQKKRRARALEDERRRNEAGDDESSRGRIIAAPVITDDFIGGAAVITF